MKNQLKITLGIVLISLCTIGCRKDSITPSTRQKASFAKFKVSSNTFKDGIDSARLRGLKLPHVSWENAPAGTAMFLIKVIDNKKHIYWTSSVIPGVDLKEQRINGEWEEGSSSDFKLPILDNGATRCTLEIVAMGKSDRILGTATAIYKIVRPKIKKERSYPGRRVGLVKTFVAAH